MKHLAIMVLVVMIFFAGCVDQSENNLGVMDDNVLSVEYEVYPKDVLPGSGGQIIFTLMNNGGFSIKNVKIFISNTFGLSITSIDCDSGDKIDGGCYFNKIFVGDEKRVIYNFHVPTFYRNDISPEFLISYDYFGQTLWKEPILKRENIAAVPSGFFKQTAGPIKVDMEGIESSDLQEEIIEGTIYQMKITVRDIAEQSQTTINKNNFKIKLTNFELYRDDMGNINCDFVLSGDELVPTEDIIISQKNLFYCLLKTKILNNIWDFGIIEINFDYNYKINKKIDIKIISKIGN